MSSPLAEVFDSVTLRRLAEGRSLQRGIGYAEAGRVKKLKVNDEEATAVVAGSRAYRVRLWVGDGSPAYSCSCPVGEDGGFCKHCVAVAHELGGKVDSQGGASNVGIGRGGLRRDLERRSKAELVELLLAQAEGDEFLRGRLLLEAAKAAGTAVDLDDYRRGIEQVINGRDFIDYRSMYDYAGGIEEVVDSIATLKEEHPAEVTELCEYALGCLEEALGRVDDSDGYMGSVRDRICDLHHSACLAARPDPEVLARRLFEWEMHSEWETFLGAAATYADVLGERGLAAYRSLAERRWRKVPTIGPGEAREPSTSHFRITYAMETLARVSGDVDALVAVKSRDLSYAYHFVEIVRAYQDAGRYGDALTWAERGLAAFPEHTDVRLREVLAEEYERVGRHDEAVALLWTELAEHPTLSSYRRLKTCVERTGAWDGWRARALELSRRMRADVSRLELEPRPRGDGWIAAGDQVSGRLVWSDFGESGKPYDVIVDGRRLTWEKFGRTLEPFEGWRFRLTIEEDDVLDLGDDEEPVRGVDPFRDDEDPLGGVRDVLSSRPDGDDDTSFGEMDLDGMWDDDEEEEFFRAWEEAEAHGVELLRRALPELVGADPPPGALDAAADPLRAAMKERRWPYVHMRRAAGFERDRLPRSNLELWLGAVGGLISMREESGLGSQEEASIMALEQADWLGAIVGLVPQSANYTRVVWTPQPGRCV